MPVFRPLQGCGGPGCGPRGGDALTPNRLCRLSLPGSTQGHHWLRSAGVQRGLLCPWVRPAGPSPSAQGGPTPGLVRSAGPQGLGRHGRGPVKVTANALLLLHWGDFLFVWEGGFLSSVSKEATVGSLVRPACTETQLPATWTDIPALAEFTLLRD